MKRLFLAGLVLAWGSVSFGETDPWVYFGCVPNPTECYYTCPTHVSAYKKGGEDCDASDYTRRYACYCQVPPGWDSLPSSQR